MSAISTKSLSSEERDQVRQIVLKASEPIAPFWPMRTMVAQNPIHGLEYLPFDQAVRKGKELLGGNGYLANEEYRQFYQNGRITQESFERGFARVGPHSNREEAVKVVTRNIIPQDIWRLHLIFGFEELPFSLLDWELNGGGVHRPFKPKGGARSSQYRQASDPGWRHGFLSRSV